LPGLGRAQCHLILLIGMYHPHFTSFVLPFATKSGILGGFCHLGCFLAVLYSNFLVIWEKSGIFGCLLPFWLLYGCFRQ
jgi:hypothetical protein